MPKGLQQKLKIYYLAKIMLRLTDEDHALGLTEIKKELDRYGVTADRKTLYNDLEDLSNFGIEVEGRQQGNRYVYRVVDRPFELPELKLLVDAIQSSKFITARKTKELIGKLSDFVSVYEASQLQRHVYVAGRIKTMNESIYYNIDAIHRAISEDRKIRFQYFSWNTKKEMELRHGGAFYHISPWGLSWDSENYYLVGFDGVAGKIKHYRVDKMLRIEVSEDKREGEEHFRRLNMADYTRKSFSMNDGVEENVKLLVKNEMANVIVDRFGKDVVMIPEDEEHFSVHVDVKVSRMFIGWVFGLGEGVKIVGPERVVEQVKKEIRRNVRTYLGDE